MPAIIVSFSSVFLCIFFFFGKNDHKATQTFLLHWPSNNDLTWEWSNRTIISLSSSLLSLLKISLTEILSPSKFEGPWWASSSLHSCREPIFWTSRPIALYISSHSAGHRDSLKINLDQECTWDQILDQRI